ADVQRADVNCFGVHWTVAIRGLSLERAFNDLLCPRLQPRGSLAWAAYRKRCGDERYLCCDGDSRARGLSALSQDNDYRAAVEVSLGRGDADSSLGNHCRGDALRQRKSV